MLTLHDPHHRSSGGLPAPLCHAATAWEGRSFDRARYVTAYHEGERQAALAAAVTGLPESELLPIPPAAGLAEEIPAGLRRGFYDARDVLSPRDRGRVARLEELPLAANPFLLDTDSGLDFELGWRATDVAIGRAVARVVPPADLGGAVERAA